MDIPQIEVQIPQRLQRRITLPASKSISNRALVISALARNLQETEGELLPIQNISDCDDSRVVVKALRESPEVVDIMAAGTAMRFLTAMYAVTPGTHTMTGTERMKHRPIAILVDALRALGAEIEYVGEEGFPPLKITGRTLPGGQVSLPGNVSSQYVSALLMIAPTMECGLTLTLTGELVSRPYIEMTIQIMRQFGAVVEWEDSSAGNSIFVSNTPYTPIPYYIESDWSAASYWYEMVALSKDKDAEVILPGLFQKSLQGDSRIKEFFQPLGVRTEFFEENGMECARLSKSTTPMNPQPSIPTPQPYTLNLIQQPDLAQTLVVTCCGLGIPFCFTGLQSLKIKETDRITALRTELRKLGFDIQEENDSVLKWNGESRVEPDPDPSIDTYEDHRMAMSFAPMALVRGGIKINNPQVVSKSYPRFWEDLL